ncbi:YceI family protein [Melioribacteraceae bacterium 4301-Me]|uniref:YceI family protein n=1 Tax=Pyranulibacter aquaticus TaxID=3163344 RepID=UPI00359BEF84
MNKLMNSFIALIVLTSFTFSQNFKVNVKGIQTFNFADDKGRNQTTFYSATPLEDINGTANGISGTVSFDPSNFAQTIKGKIVVAVNSLNTGINLRNHHLMTPNWLDEKKYPLITFEIKSVSDIKQLADNKLEFKVTGAFTLHGVTKEITADAEATYLNENEQTRKRAPGDLLGVRAKFTIKLSDYGVSNELIGSKVAENIEIGVNIVGSNKI